jgi:hypothetical protein
MQAVRPTFLVSDASRLAADIRARLVPETSSVRVHQGRQRVNESSQRVNQENCWPPDGAIGADILTVPAGGAATDTSAGICAARAQDEKQAATAYSPCDVTVFTTISPATFIVQGCK